MRENLGKAIQEPRRPEKIVTVRRSRDTTASQFSRELYGTTRIRVSRVTTSRRLQERAVSKTCLHPSQIFYTGHCLK
ncbi:hypothetical protein TNCV_4280841 [Trichonephila clavipes]|nr:hypothetical protein TNCV_4280841 [Trichonephila clavipes]